MIGPRWRNHAALTLALGLALLIAWLFYPSLGSSHNLAFARESADFLTLIKALYTSFRAGALNLDLVADPISQWGLTGLLSRGIQAAFFQFLGLSEVALLWPTLLIHLFNITLLFLLIKQLAGRWAALIAALAWAWLPSDLSLSLAGGLQFSLLFLGLLLLSRSPFTSGRKSALLFVTLPLFLENYWFGLALLAHCLFRSRPRWASLRPLLFALPIALFLIVGGDLESVFDQTTRLLRAPAFSLILFLGLLALASRRVGTEPDADLEGLAASELLALVVLPELLLGQAIEFSYPILALLFLLPIGRHLAQFLTARASLRWLWLLIALLAVQGFLLHIAHARQVPFPASGQHTVLYILLILQGLLIVVAFLGLLLKRDATPRLSAAYGWLLSFLMLSALLGQAASAGAEQRARDQAHRAFAAALAEQAPDASLAILGDRRLKDELELFLPPDAPEISVVDAGEFSSTSADWLLIWNSDFTSQPQGWRWLAAFGLAGPQQLHLFERSSASLYCDEFSQLIQAQRDPAEGLELLPVDLAELANCSSSLELVDRIEQLIAQRSDTAYLQPRWVEADAYLSASQKYTHRLDPAPFQFILDLEPSSAYLYSVEVQALEPVSLLYWGSETEEGVLGGGTFPEWQRFTVLLLTPGWASPQTLNFSPVLFDHYGEVLLRDFYLQRLELAP